MPLAWWIRQYQLPNGAGGLCSSAALLLLYQGFIKNVWLVVLYVRFKVLGCHCQAPKTSISAWTVGVGVPLSVGVVNKSLLPTLGGSVISGNVIHEANHTMMLIRLPKMHAQQQQQQCLMWLCEPYQQKNRIQ